MDTKRICTICGKPLAPGAPEGLCPECLLKAGLGTGVDIGADTGKAPRFVPPKIEELAAKFPQLEILEFIGQGGMGAVYKALQKQLDRIVALKILPPQAAAGAGFAERFTREARALARLNHPHIVTLYEFGQADGLFYFLMEFVDGVNLRQLLNTSRMASREALAIVPQICDALQFAHDTGIVHRDIKPENILLDKKGQVKIADFGVAKLVTQGMEETAAEKTPSSGDLTEAGSSLGTPQYMAPEQIKNSAEVDHRADIYSLGVVFYQMLTGELPSGKIEPPSKKVVIDVRLDEVVLRALEKKPELRFQQASDVKTIVETIATTPQPSAPTTPSGWKHYKDQQWNYELDIPPGWNPFPPVHSNSPYEVIRFMSHENGKHAMILFRRPHAAIKSLKDVSDETQQILAKQKFGNFVSGETTIGSRPARTLDFDRPQDDRIWSCREYFLAEGTLGYVLGFGTTNKAAMFEIFDCMAKSFQFQVPISIGGQPIPHYLPQKIKSATADVPKPETSSPGTQAGLPSEGYSVRIEPNPSTEIPDRKLAFIKIPFVTLHDGKPRTNWPIVLITGVLLEFLVLFGLILGGDMDIPNVLDTRPIVLIVLPIMALIPLWLRYEIRAGHNTLAQGQPRLPLLSRRKKPLHRATGCLLAVLFVAFFLRIFVIAPYRVDTDSAAPEIPRGSHFLVWKLTHNFLPGDIIAYKVGNDVFISRVVRAENDRLLVNKNGRPDTMITRNMVVGKVISIYWRGTVTPTPTNVEFHVRVFEEDASLVDQLIPASQRKSGVQPDAISVYPPGMQSTSTTSIGSFSVTTHGGGETDSQMAKVSLDVLDALLDGIAPKPGLLVDRTRVVTSDWWHPGLIDGWSYSQSDVNGFSGGGAGNAFFGVQQTNGILKVRIECQLNHGFAKSVVSIVHLNSKLLFEGPLSPKTNALVFIVPFVRPNGSAHYLVVAFDFNGSAGPRVQRVAAPAEQNTNAIRQRFEPTPGMADKTSWGVENHSEFNPDGWAVLANMTLGGVARITPGMLNGQTEAFADQSQANDVCRIKLVDGDDDRVTLDVNDLKWNKRITLKLNRDQWADLTVNGINYKIGYCSVWVAPDKPDASPFANVLVTHSEVNH